MKLSELLNLVKSDHHINNDIEIKELTYDSRKAHDNSFFFCLSGSKVDGHDFADSAYESGCRLFAVERILDLPEDAEQILVKNTRESLSLYSAAFYDFPSQKMRVAGITGTKGKTSTAVYVQKILNDHGIKCGYIGTIGVIYGSHYYSTNNSTPESLDINRYMREMLDEGIKHVVIEVSSQALVNYRVNDIKFDIVAYTNLSPDHISPTEHHSFEEYRDAKKRLFTDFNSTFAIYNIDDEYSAYMLSDNRSQKISYGIKGNGVYQGEGIMPYKNDSCFGIKFRLILNGTETYVSLKTPGKFSVYNALCAIAISHYMGVMDYAAIESLSDATVPGRFEIFDPDSAKKHAYFVIDYAHNGYSLDNVLRVLKYYSPERIICLFGSVGGRSYSRRKELAETASRYADISIITSDNPDYEDPVSIIDEIAGYYEQSKEYYTFADREEAVRFAVDISRPGDIVLFAGKGHEDYQLISGKKVKFSEKEIIKDELSEPLAY